jgi:nicotinamide mononucleotide adenylyltransferase
MDFEKIKKNLLSLENDKTPIVLIGTGSYNPVHIMHLEIFKIAKEQLYNKYNFQVVGAYISPSCKQYVQSKLGDDFIEDVHRIKLIELSIKDSEYESWMSVDT